ncbi:MAG: hypothetical protein H0U95_04970 [Bacteroidetes bacterium]|nr:hypothetical protein [Bacteroidota bacterium]
MGRFLDLLTGKLYSFKNANGSDINIGLSDKLIVSPKALSESDVFCNTSIPLVLPSVFSTKSALFVINPNVIVIPTNGNFYPNRSTQIKTQFFANVYVNAGLMGELCLVDLATNKIVAGSTISFKNISYTTIASNVFNVEAGKVYSFALRRSNGTSTQLVYLRAATLTLKFITV